MHNVKLGGRDSRFYIKGENNWMTDNKRYSLIIFLVIFFLIISPIVMNSILKNAQLFPKKDLVLISGKIITYKCSHRLLSSLTLDTGRVISNFRVTLPPNEMRECFKKPKVFFVGKNASFHINPENERVYEWVLNNDVIYTYEQSKHTDTNSLQSLSYIFLLMLTVSVIGLINNKYRKNSG